MKMVRDEESYIVRSFFKSFKQNFKQATLIHLLLLFAGLLIYADLRIVTSMDTLISKVLYYIFLVFVLLYVMLVIYIYPVLAKFYNTIRNTFQNAFLMSVRHLPYTFVMVIIYALPLAILLIPSATIQSCVLLLFFLMGGAVLAYCNSFFLRKIFDRYIPEEENASEAIQ
jgi:uncharacterized membrane protein YesL